MLEAIIEELKERSQIQLTYLFMGDDDAYTIRLHGHLLGTIHLQNQLLVITPIKPFIKASFDLNDPEVDIIEEVIQKLYFLSYKFRLHCNFSSRF